MRTGSSPPGAAEAQCELGYGPSPNRFLNRQSHKSIRQFTPLLLFSRQSSTLRSSNLKIKQEASLRTPQAAKHRRFPPPGFLLLEHLTDFSSVIADLPQPSSIFPHCQFRQKSNSISRFPFLGCSMLFSISIMASVSSSSCS